MLLRIGLWLLLLVTVLSVPTFAATETAVRIKSIATQGFTVNDFTADNTYYLCYPDSFENIKFTDIQPNISASVNINVERYCDYKYTTDYSVGETLTPGYGRAKVTVTLTSKTDSTNTASYLFVLTDPAQADYRYRRFTKSTKVYASASTTSSVICTLSASTGNNYMPLCIETKGNMTKIVVPSGYSVNHGKIGWVETQNLVEEYQAVERPDTYAAAIKALKKAHPNWTFEYRYMGMNMDEYAEHIVKLYKVNTGKSISLSTVLKNMDPLSFLDEKSVFMFLDVNRYNADHFTEEGIGGLWVEQKGSAITEEQATEYLLSAGKSLQVNPYFITARTVTEAGFATSKLANGVTGTDGKLYYNYFGIKAFDLNNQGAYYAEQRGWDTPYRSIVEGANWVTDQYLHRGQLTPYFFRYYPYKDHLYMSDLEAPKKDADKLYTCYKSAGKLDEKLHFIIPYFGFRYSDVLAGKWYYDDVYRATDYGLFEGVSKTEFNPDGILSRAQLVTVLARISGVDVSTYSTDRFTDVEAGSWYENAVAWAFESGVVKGISDTAFAPQDPISRQDLCTMLVRFAKAKKYALPDAADILFADDDTIGSWAKTAVYRCVAAGLVDGVGDNCFNPCGDASRAQGAKILSLFYESYVAKK